MFTLAQALLVTKVGKAIRILVGLPLTSIFIIDYSGWLANVTTTALIFVSENGKNDQNRTGMNFGELGQCFPSFVVLSIFYVWLVYNMMDLTTLRLSQGNTKLSESVWSFEQKTKSNFATGNKSSFS